MDGRSLVGRTVRWRFDDGPTKGKTFEHTLRPDGRLTYGEPGHGKAHARYELETIRPGVVALSYLGGAGYTLTSVLDLAAGTVVAFASNERELVVQHGRFEVEGLRVAAPRLGNRPMAR